MMRRAFLTLFLVTTPMCAFAGDEIFERDLSTPFLRDDDDRLLRDRDLPGPLRKTWPYSDTAERPFKAVEARRACHARTLFEIREMGGGEAKATARLESQRDGPLRFLVIGQYEGEFDGERKPMSVTCVVSSQAVTTFSLN